MGDDVFVLGYNWDPKLFNGKIEGLNHVTRTMPLELSHKGFDT